MKKILALIGLIVFQASVLSAATISLSGTVKDADGTGIEGVELTLANLEDITGVTDAQGSFSLIGTGVNGSHSIKSISTLRIRLSGNRIMFSLLPINSIGQIDVFSSNGKKTAHLRFNSNDAGEATLKLPQLTPGLHHMRLITENRIVNRTLLCLGKSEIQFSDAAAQKRGMNLAKQSAAPVVDTLIAAKDGYDEVKIVLDSYDKSDIEVVMTEPMTGEMPLVYDNEWVGEDCPMPDLVDDPMTLPEIEYHPDPFLFADGTTRMTSLSEWHCRRAEIKALLEKYDAGIKPGPPDNVEATLSGNNISIICTEGGNSLTLSASISYPGSKPDSPVPAIIGVSGMGHSLPDVFSGRGIASINFDPLQVMAHSGARNSGSFIKLYPDLQASGGFIRWAWAFSRLIDALELLPDAQIDTKHLAVSGCSYAGKVALFCGAWDERVALTLPHESGGGGTISWRYSDMLEDRDRTEVENLHHAQGVQWYAAGLKKYEPMSVSPNL